MKTIIITILTITISISACKDDIKPTTPITPPLIDNPLTPAADRKMCFHCDIHNLSYRYTQYILLKNRKFSMSCPVCDLNKSVEFMQQHEFTNEIQLLCPIDSTWSSIYIFDGGIEKNFLLRKRIPFTPIVPAMDSLRKLNLNDMKVAILNKENKNYKYFPYCWCDACYSKVRLETIKFKEDSIITIRQLMNHIIGIDKQPYPINEGVPIDRRIRAKAILDSIEAIMPQLDRFYNKNYSSINWFVGGFYCDRQRYIYSQKEGTPIDSWVDEDVAYSQISKEKYISDTVVITIGGGPDYWIGGGTPIPLFKSKTRLYTPKKTKEHPIGFPNLSQGQVEVKRKSISKINGQSQFTSEFSPDKVDFMPNEYFPRKYNTPSTSVFIIHHPQKGNQFNSDNITRGTWPFVDMGKSQGGWDKKFPNNIVSVETAELINDIGVMQIRNVVEWCKTRNKKVVILGTSWGGAMIMRYLLYYPASDFDFILIADQNPNIQKEIVEKDYENWIYNTAKDSYGSTNYLELNKNMCVLASSPYRRLNWLKNQNLSNAVFYSVDKDDVLGGIPSEDILTLKSLGAKVYQFPNSVGHGVFHKDNVWTRKIVPTQM